MIILKRIPLVFHLVFFLIFSEGCKEKEIIPFPENDEFSIIEKTSIDGRDTISIYEGKIDIDLKFPLNTFTSINSSDYNYSVNFIKAVLIDDSSDKIIETEDSVSNQKVEVVFDKLSTSREYNL